MIHHCHAEGCIVVVPPRLLMCARHWAMVPVDLQQAVYQTYRPGQERGIPSLAWLDAATEAQNHVRRLEGYRERPLPSTLLLRVREVTQ